MIFNKKKWKKIPYKDSIDYLLAYEIHAICKFNINDIIVWYAKKEKDCFNYFLFQYKKKYYRLHNTSLVEITKDDIFKQQKK